MRLFLLAICAVALLIPVSGNRNEPGRLPTPTATKACGISAPTSSAERSASNQWSAQGTTVRRLFGLEARSHFMGRISARVLYAAIQDAGSRGWTPTDRFAIIQAGDLRRRGIIRTSSRQDIISDAAGELAIWEWDTGNPNTWGATLVLTNSLGEAWTFDEEYDISIGETGESIYTQPLNYRDGQGLDHNPLPAVLRADPQSQSRIVRIGFETSSQPTCQQEKAQWRQCNKDCLAAMVNRTMWAGFAGMTAGLRTCVTHSTRAGVGGPWVAAGAFLLCEAGSGGLAAGIWMIRENSSGGCQATCGAPPC